MHSPLQEVMTITGYKRLGGVTPGLVTASWPDSLTVSPELG